MKLPSIIALVVCIATVSLALAVDPAPNDLGVGCGPIIPNSCRDACTISVEAPRPIEIKAVQLDINGQTVELNASRACELKRTLEQVFPTQHAI